MVPDVSLIEVFLLFLLGATEPSDLEPLPEQTVVRFLPPDCEITGFVDLRGVGDGAEALTARWREHPFLLDIPDVSSALDALDGLRGRVHAGLPGRFGFDPFEDLTAFSFCVEVKSDTTGWPLPQIQTVMQGNFEASAAARLASEFGLIYTPGDDTYRDAYNQLVLAEPEPGVMVLGSASYVDPMMAGGWSIPPPPPGTTTAHMLDRASLGMRYYLSFDPGLAMSLMFVGFSSTSLTDLISGLERGVVVGRDDAVTFEVIGRTPVSLRDYELMLTGIGFWAQSIPTTFRGAVSLLFGFAQPGDAVFTEQTQALAAHREEILDILMSAGALSPPVVSVLADTSTLTVTMTLTHIEGFQLLVRNLIAASYLGANGLLPEAIESIVQIPNWWSSRFGVAVP